METITISTTPSLTLNAEGTAYESYVKISIPKEIVEQGAVEMYANARQGWSGEGTAIEAAHKQIYQLVVEDFKAVLSQKIYERAEHERQTQIQAFDVLVNPIIN